MQSLLLPRSLAEATNWRPRSVPDEREAAAYHIDLYLLPKSLFYQ
jgi:hypothetical protein